LAWEKELLGLYVSQHPAGLFFDHFAAYVTPTKGGLTADDGSMVTMCGVISYLKQIFTKAKNEPMAFIRFDDPTGTIEAVAFPKTYARIKTRLVPDAFIVVSGKIAVRKRDEGEEEKVERSLLIDDLVTFTEAEIPALQEMLANGNWKEKREAVLRPVENGAMGGARGTFVIILPNNPPTETIVRLRTALKEHAGNTRVQLQVQSGSEEKRIVTEYSVEPTVSLAKAVEKILGTGTVLYS
jgi:DNA polymerase-3 subunit alpha